MTVLAKAVVLYLLHSVVEATSSSNGRFIHSLRRAIHVYFKASTPVHLSSFDLLVKSSGKNVTENISYPRYFRRTLRSSPF